VAAHRYPTAGYEGRGAGTAQPTSRSGASPDPCCRRERRNGILVPERPRSLGRAREMRLRGNKLWHSSRCEGQLWGNCGANTSPPGAAAAPCLPCPAPCPAPQTPGGQGLLHFPSFVAQNRKISKHRTFTRLKTATGAWELEPQERRPPPAPAGVGTARLRGRRGCKGQGCSQR